MQTDAFRGDPTDISANKNIQLLAKRMDVVVSGDLQLARCKHVSKPLIDWEWGFRVT